jgi:mono/diheme cytochrome c family protein
MEARSASRARRLALVALVAVVVAETAWLVYPAVRRRVIPTEDTSAARGQQLAHALGCFACHGPGGAGAVKNPGSEEGEVPAFTERTQMMYVKSTQDLREYILDGAPRRKREDPDYRKKMDAAVLRMPAYRPFVTDAQVEDLVAYLRAASDQIVPEDATAARGAELAATLHCFACHGPLGAGGVPDPGSFKGYVPGFWGADFDELVHDDDELRQWIAEGRIARIAEHPVGRAFFERQAIKMPAYGEHVSADDITALAAYVRWIRTGTWHPLAK